MIRPIKPEDAIITQAFMRDLSPHSKYFRFMQHIRELTPAMLVRLTQIDYDREMTFIATIDENGKEIAIGLAHYVTNPDRESSEFAIVIADAWQNKGIGSKLMNALTQEAKAQHLSVMMGFVIATNTSMLELTKRLGFVVSNSDDPTVKIVTRYL
jgi:acetyltransferase